MTRSEILTQIAYRTNKNASTLDTLTQNRLLGFVNERQRRLLTIPGLTHLRDATVPISSVADQASYVLTNINKVSRIWDPVNQRVLWEMSQQDYRLTDPDPLTGTPEAVVWQGRQQVAKHPSDASSIFAKSTSASDTTQTVYVEGVITGGYAASGSVTLTGTTAVNLSATFSTWTRIDKFYLSAVAVGSVTLHEDSGAGTELARIPIGQTSSPYFGFTLWPTPSGVIDYEVDITRAVTDLAQNTDVPVLPEDFHDLLVIGPVADEYKHTKDERWKIFEEQYGGTPAQRGKGGRVGDLLYYLSELAIGRPRSLVRGWERPSQLGGWFPAGT